MTIPVPPPSGEGVSNGYKGDATPNLRLLCSITGGTSPAQWEDITGTTPLTFIKDCVSFTTNVSARFWLADCHQVLETVGLASQLYRELICVPYMAKFVVFAKTNDPVESSLRCFCMTDDRVDKTLEQQENFEEVARSKDIEVLEGKPIYVDCYGNLAPLTKGGQQLVFNFYSFKENRLPFSIKIRDTSQEPCGRLSFLKEPKTTKGLPQTAVCNLNITLPAHKKAEKADRRQSFASLALRKRYSYLTEPSMSPQSPCERTDIRMAIVADHLGLSWTELARELNFSVDEINQIRVENPNSLISQSFMLLKKWVTRDGKNATTDALTSVLTKINRIDIVTLLEGPIFDYGNISGTRSFADENNVFHDPVDGWQNETPSGSLESPAQARRLTGGLLDRLDDSSDQARDSITSYLTGEPGKIEANGNHTAEVIPEAKAKPYFPESQNDIGKQSIKENLKPKTHGCGRTEEPVSPLTAYQKSLEETSKLVIEDAPKPCVPVGMKKMTRTTADGKARLNLQEEEGSTRSEPKQGEGYKVKTKKEIRNVEKKTH